MTNIYNPLQLESESVKHFDLLESKYNVIETNDTNFIAKIPLEIINTDENNNNNNNNSNSNIIIQDSLLTIFEKFIRKNHSLIIIGFIILVGDMARGLLFPVIWSLCQEVNGTAVDLGLLLCYYCYCCC